MPQNLKGVKEEANVGTRTTLDVLDAEQESLQEAVELIIVKNNILSTKYVLKILDLLPNNKGEIKARIRPH